MNAAPTRTIGRGRLTQTTSRCLTTKKDLLLKKRKVQKVCITSGRLKPHQALSLLGSITINQAHKSVLVSIARGVSKCLTGLVRARSTFRNRRIVMISTVARKKMGRLRWIQPVTIVFKSCSKTSHNKTVVRPFSLKIPTRANQRQRRSILPWSTYLQLQRSVPIRLSRCRSQIRQRIINRLSSRARSRHSDFQLEA